MPIVFLRKPANLTHLKVVIFSILAMLPHCVASPVCRHCHRCSAVRHPVSCMDIRRMAGHRNMLPTGRDAGTVYNVYANTTPGASSAGTAFCRKKNEKFRVSGKKVGLPAGQAELVQGTKVCRGNTTGARRDWRGRDRISGELWGWPWEPPPGQCGTRSMEALAERISVS